IVWGINEMKYLIILLIAIIVFYVFTFLRQRASMTTLTQDQFIEGYRKAQLVDVREPQEFDRGHIWGVRNIPLTQLKQSINTLDPDRPVYLYCQNYTRSPQDASVLKKNKFNNINVLKRAFKKITAKVNHKKKRFNSFSPV